MHYTNEKNIKHKDLSPAQTAALAGKSILYRFFRAVMVTSTCIFLVWFILPIFVYEIINPYNIFGIVVCSAIILFYSNRIFFIYIRKLFYSKKASKIIWKTGKYFIYAFAVYAILISIVMGVCASIPPAENASSIMLGAQVKGTEPSLMLYDRITAGEKFLSKNPDSICVVTGGLGETAEITEAQCMYNVLTENGISSDRIFLEEKAKNTQENIRFSYDIIKNAGASENIAIVSDGFHQARARLIAVKQGISGQIGAVSSDTNLILLPTYWVREWFCLPFELIFK